jgi:hypothetical protein
MSLATCPRCGAPRAEAPECPRCGVIYARAQKRAAVELEASPPPDALSAPRRSAAAEFVRSHVLAEARAELLLAKLAVPCTLLGWWALVHVPMGRFLARTFFGMWLHELGHAVAAWLCGYPAFPGPWFTPTAGERSPLLVLLIVAGLGWAAWRGWTEDRRLPIAVAGAALLVQAVCTLGLSARSARTLITFAGGVGSLVFGGGLMATFFVPKGHKLHRDWLRWGFLVIGAASFADTFYEWWRVRADLSAVAFGANEGRGPTDPSVLASAGWSVPLMTSRYLGIGVLCLLALAGMQLLHVRRTRAALLALESGAREPEALL